MIFDFDFALSILPLLLRASIITITATIVSFAIALVGGFVLLGGIRSRFAVVRWIVWPCVQFVRSTPLLVQLYFLFFVLPSFGIMMSPFLTGVLAMGVHYSCYIAEVYRAGLESVPRGQWEAATSLNYSRSATMTQIIIPQAIPPMIPVLANYMIAMFKDTPILASITIIELMQTANIIAAEKFLYVEPMTLVGLLFLGMSLVASVLIRMLEARYVR